MNRSIDVCKNGLLLFAARGGCSRLGEQVAPPSTFQKVWGLRRIPGCETAEFFADLKCRIPTLQVGRNPQHL